MIQAVLLFLLLVALLGFGAKWLRLPPRRERPDPSLHVAARCPSCRAFVIGRQP